MSSIHCILIFCLLWCFCSCLLSDSVYPFLDAGSSSQGCHVVLVTECDPVLAIVLSCARPGVCSWLLLSIFGVLVVCCAQLLTSLGACSLLGCFSSQLALLRSRQEVFRATGILADVRSRVGVHEDLPMVVQDA